jgi:predicted DNA-binding antitoxin AbrB/MazE fold protein
LSKIHAVYRDGVFKPKEQVHLSEGSEVTVELISFPAGTQPLDREVSWLVSRTSEDIQRSRQEIQNKSRPPVPLPEGRTLADVVEGQWPGDETDDQIRVALERLS